MLEADRASWKETHLRLKRLISSSASSQAQSLPNDACLSPEKYEYSFVCLRPGLFNNKPIRPSSSLTWQSCFKQLHFSCLQGSAAINNFILQSGADCEPLYVSLHYHRHCLHTTDKSYDYT